MSSTHDQWKPCRNPSRCNSCLNTYEKDQPVIKWGGIVIAVAGVASALFG